jgi:hypothetical protein
MVARFSSGTSIKGVIAYQDHSDPNQFYYIPSSVPLVPGETLEDFNVTYFGVSSKHQAWDPASGSYRSIVGASLAGRAKIGISDIQRKDLVKQIKKVFVGIEPKLLPLPLKTVSVQPTLARATLGIETGVGDVVFPTDVVFETSFNYVVAARNNVFGIFAAAQGQGSEITSNPQFGINVVGEAEFLGDPWTVDVDIDLSQVWSYVRKKIGVSASWGWFRLGSASYTSIVQNLTREFKSSLNLVEGSLDTEKFGRQILEFGKTLFEEINRKAIAGEGFFKFEPNPSVEESESTSGGGASFPWSVSVNASYYEQHFTQEIRFKQTVSFTGRFWRRIPFSMSLAVLCNSATSKYFIDLNSSEPCVTSGKVKSLNDRIDREIQLKAPYLKKLLDKLTSGEITPEDYAARKRAIMETSFSEDAWIFSEEKTEQLFSILAKEDLEKMTKDRAPLDNGKAIILTSPNYDF